ncbi:McrB family protein [Flavobacterium aquidurense]|jgi:5-methylcytosine-specific restriction protein B|uniref:McrB family protein n=1 Tax=Flavobacterium aquidurense TaxID=362413 RepID=UPI00091D5980|nr:AAA family ATPase [Flavobacterium aquidurense]SHG15079.1 AAA domain (dynein-related subfamily) [Flavobacterium frigidimaris]
MSEENISITNVLEFIRVKAEEFGANNDKEFNKSYVERNNTKPDVLKDRGAFFGFIHPEEESGGPFHDFSLTIFPSIDNKPWLVCLGIGSNGFKNDYELANYPGVRRLFSKLINEKGYCKSDFADIETPLPKTIANSEDLEQIKNTIKTYTKVLPACQIVENPESEEGKKIITAFVAGYAKLRNWPSNKDQRKAISDALNPFFEEDKINEVEEIKNLLSERKYVVLQGSPGTGKTRTAKEVAEKMKAKTFFTQFHAETSFSDFIFGIRPDLNNENLSYKENLGILTKALKHAKENDETTLLIIDEINRANLSNVLGPIFYLFEHKMDKWDVEIEISPDFKINKLPNNFHVIATMNTADRSLSVIDFALRRRFAWYNLKPRPIIGKKKNLENASVYEINNSEEYFFFEDFLKINEIFDWYASSNELSLQPGQGYFIAKSEEEMKSRIQYEIFPLIKEYLQEGLVRNAKEEFNNYFTSRINQSLFE